jgi:hypothetical protein
MRSRNFFSFNKCFSKLFILLFVVNQFIVFYMIWDQFVIKETLKLEEVSTSTSENVTSAIPETKTTEIPTTPGRYTMIHEENRRITGPYQILLATDTNKTPRWGLGKAFISSDDFKSVDCLYTNCEASATTWSNKAFSVLDFDAVVFNTHYIGLIKYIFVCFPFMLSRLFLDIGMPKLRSTRQQYIMCGNE